MSGITRLRRIDIGLVLCAALALASASLADEPPDQDAMSAEELSRQLNNPVSSIWSFNLQSNIVSMKNSGEDLPNWNHGNTEWFYNLNFQPVIPLHLTDSWNLITRPVFPFYAERPVLDDDEIEHEGGLGDINLFSLFSPAQEQAGILWGVGPSFIFPSATKNALGQEKWQAGPAAVALHLGHEWIFGVLAQQWWSFAGDDSAPKTSQANVQYFLYRLLPDEWQIGMGPNMTVDWEADDGNEVTFPVGLGAGKLVKFGKFPVKFTFEVDYAVVHPDDVGQRWNLRLQIIPVLPALVKRKLLPEF